MNILFLAHRIPYPPDKGEKIRAWHMLRYLASRHRVHLVAFVDDPADFAHVDYLRSVCRGRCYFPFIRKSSARLRMVPALLASKPLTCAHFPASALRKWIDDLLKDESIERFFVYSSAMAPALLERVDVDHRKVIFDMVDVDSDKWRQYANSMGRIRGAIYARECRTLEQIERRAASRFAATLLASPFEAETFLAAMPTLRSKVHAVRNGVDAEYFSHERVYPDPYSSSNPKIVMTGMMDYHPNVDGACWFATEVFPKVLKEFPSAQYFVVGARPTSKVRALQSESVRVTGRVDDVRGYLAHASVVVAPLRLARGIQNKVLEGMAMQRPVVATAEASRALDVTHGAELLIANSSADFATNVEFAIRNGTDVAACGRKHIESFYRWEANLRQVEALMGSPNEMPDGTQVAA